MRKCIIGIIGFMGIVILAETVYVIVLATQKCPTNVWTVIGTSATIASAVATTMAAIFALYTANKANETNKNMLDVQQKQYLFSMAPNIQCYLRMYKTKSGVPFIVLETKNFGGLTARDIVLQISYPDGIKECTMGDDATALIGTPFTLPPNKKLSTPLLFSGEEDLLDGNVIEVEGKFFYYNQDHEKHEGQIPRMRLTMNEFNLFNAINFAPEE